MNKILLSLLTAFIIAGCSSAKAPKPHGAEFPINSTLKVVK